jgi:hypothetical protein
MKESYPDVRKLYYLTVYEVRLHFSLATFHQRGIK